jgi:hypothetical protein
LLVTLSILLFTMSTLLAISITLLAGEYSLCALFKVNQILHMKSEVFNVPWKISTKILKLPALSNPFRKELNNIRI